MTDKYNILIVDDDPYILDAFQVILEDRENCNLFLAGSFIQAQNIVDKTFIDLAIVDIVLPEIDGYDICKALKNHPNAERCYFILMSADKHHLLDRLKAYKSGAQEFLSKPFDFKEVEMIIDSKIEYWLKTKDLYDYPSVKTIGVFLIEDKAKKVMVGSEQKTLSAMEYMLLKYFINNPEILIGLEQIMSDIWGSVSQTTTGDNVRHLIRNLRNKIEEDPKNPIYIINSRKSGYIFYPSGQNNYNDLG